MVQAASKDQEELKMKTHWLLSVISGKPTFTKPIKKEHMYVDVCINGKATRAMVNTGVTHNYIVDAEVQCLGLKLEKDLRKMKVVTRKLHPC